MSHLKDRKKTMTPIPSKKKNGRGSSQAFVPHNEGISEISLLLLLFGFSQKLFHISDIDTRK
jgi:hypothetical protein